MDGINNTLDHLSLTQMLLAWVFVGCYALAFSGMLNPAGSVNSGLVASAAAIGFVALSDVWVHGALLVLFAVAGMGLFVAVAWALSAGTAQLLSLSAERPAATPAATVSSSSAPASARPLGVWRALQRLRMALG